MDEVALPEHARDPRTGLRRLAPEIEAARDQIVDHFEDKPFSELKTFVQKLLEIEEDETKRLGALAEAFAAAPEDNNFRGEWPSAWGGREDVRGPHQNAPPVDRGRRGMQLQPDAMHDRGQAREMSELERLEMEHRIHQQKLRELSLV